jgi:hypothetical protein
VDLQGMSGRTIAGDAHFFEDATTPAKVRAYLDSTKVSIEFCTVITSAVILPNAQSFTE